MKLEEQLRTLRQEKGLSQTELAEMMDVTRQAISRWETGVVVPATENLVRLSKLYDVPLDEMVHGGIAVTEEQELPEQPETAEPPGQVERRPGGRKIAVWAAAVLCLLALAAGIVLGRTTAPEESDMPVILDMEDMKGREFEIIPGNTFALESLQEGR